MNLSLFALNCGEVVYCNERMSGYYPVGFAWLTSAEYIFTHRRGPKNPIYLSLGALMFQRFWAWMNSLLLEVEHSKNLKLVSVFFSQILQLKWILYFSATKVILDKFKVNNKLTSTTSIDVVLMPLLWTLNK